MWNTSGATAAGAFLRLLLLLRRDTFPRSSLSTTRARWSNDIFEFHDIYVD